MGLPAFTLGPSVGGTSRPESPDVAARDAVLGTYKRGPVEMVRGEGVYLFDGEGNRYLDFVSGIAVNALGYGDAGLIATMQAAAEGVQDRLVKDGISLDLHADPDVGTFIADERRVRQVLFNLLSNAVGFSPPGGSVTLAVERTPDAVSFSVSDQGPGIPEELKDKVFEWFETHSHGSRHRGVGLGLSLVRSFVELHGGTVRIDSRPGQGTTVTCTFPLTRDDSTHTAAA